MKNNLLLFIAAFFLCGCDSDNSDSGSSLFDSLTSTSDITEYLTLSDRSTSPAFVFGRITYLSQGIIRPVAGAWVSTGTSSSAVSDQNGYYRASVLLSASPEVLLETVTISVKCPGFSDLSQSVKLKKNTASEINLSLFSLYTSDQPRGIIYGTVRDSLSSDLLDSLSVSLDGVKTLSGSAGNSGSFFFGTIETGLHSLVITDPAGYFRDYYTTVETVLGSNHILCELTRSGINSASETGTLSGIVRDSSGRFISGATVVLDAFFHSVSDASGWFILSDSTGIRQISSGTHLLSCSISGTSEIYAGYTSSVSISKGENFHVITLQALE